MSRGILRGTRRAVLLGGGEEASAYPLDFLTTADAAGDGALIAAYDAAYSTLLDAPAGSAVTPDGACGSISDLGGAEGPAVQATIGARPTYRATGINGGPALEFDGGDALQLATWAGGEVAQPLTYVAFGSVNGNGAVMNRGSGTGSGFYADTNWKVYAGGTADTGDAADTALHAFVVHLSGASTVFYLDGVSLGTLSPGATGCDGATLGANNSLSLFLPAGSLFGAWAYYDGWIGTTALAYMVAASQARWGTP